MTKIAGVWPAIINALLRGRPRDLVRTHRVQQAKGRVRHVTIVTAAARRIGRMVRVRADVRANRLVALQTRLV